MPERINIQCRDCGEQQSLAVRSRGSRFTCRGCGESGIVSPKPKRKRKQTALTQSKDESVQEEEGRSGPPAWLVPAVVGGVAVLMLATMPLLNILERQTRTTSKPDPILDRMTETIGEFRDLLATAQDADSARNAIPRLNECIDRYVMDRKESMKSRDKLKDMSELREHVSQSADSLKKLMEMKASAQKEWFRCAADSAISATFTESYPRLRINELGAFRLSRPDPDFLKRMGIQPHQ